MRRNACLLLLLVLLSAAVIVAGCTSPSPSARPANVTPTPSKPVVIDQGGLMFNMSQFHMFQYDIIASDGTASARVGNMKAEYNITPYGNVSNARHMKETRVIGEGSDAKTTVTDLYYKLENNWILGGHATTTTANGTTERDIQDNDPAYWNYDMATVSSNVQFYDEGTEYVVVPKGMYPAAKKYTSTDSSITLWMASGVPVPVKIGGAADNNNTAIRLTMELVNYE